MISFFVLIQSIELGNVFCEVVIKCRKLFCFDFVDGAFKYCCFSSKLFCLIILWESNVYFLLLFQSCANELLFESRNEGMGAKGQRIIFSSAAVERNAVYRTFEVKCNGISVCCRTILYIDGSCIFLLLFFQLSFYFFICNGCVSFCYFQTFVLAKGNFRFYCYSCGKDESFAFFVSALR